MKTDWNLTEIGNENWTLSPHKDLKWAVGFGLILLF